MRTAKPEKRSYAIIGTGAVGGYYGGLLARAGFDVHFLLRSDYEHVREHGLRIESKDGDFSLPQVRAYARAADLPPCDVAVIALKTTSNHLLSELLPPAVREDGAVLTLQNGLGPEEEAARVVGDRRVLGGLCFLCSMKAGPGRIRHLDYGQITMGEYNPNPAGPAVGITERLRAIAADFRAAGVNVALCEDLRVARWKKLLWNIPFNALSIILDAATDAIMRDPHTEALARAAMEDVQAAARACGYTIEDSAIEENLELTRRMAPYRSSMKIDYDEGRPLETEAIYGNPLRAALAAGYRPPIIESFYRLLKFLEARRRAL